MAERIRTVSRRPASLGSVPPGAISLAMGEPDADTPALVVDAAIGALRAGRTRYEPLTGSPLLREAIARRLSEESGATVTADRVVVTHGATAGLAAAIIAIVGPGDTVVLPEPTYSLYADHVAMAGGQVVWVPTCADGRLRLDLIEQAAPGAALIVLCNPGNPTGQVVPTEDVSALVDIAARHGAYLLSDEAYADIVFDGVEVASIVRYPGAPEIAICCRTFSKSYAMTGWRLGYVTAPEEIASRINLIHRTLNGALATFVQDAGVAALALPDEHVTRLRHVLQERRDLVVDAMKDVPFIDLATPRGAFYAFPRVDRAAPSQELAEVLASRGGVLVRAGSEYGPSGEGHLRLSFATGEQALRTGIERFLLTLEGLT